MNHAWWSNIIYITSIIFLIYFFLLMIFYLYLAILGFIENKMRSYKQEEESYPLMYLSNLVIPVSIILPAHNEELWIKDSLLSILNLNYPIFEIIVVDDGSVDHTFDMLNEILVLKEVDCVIRRHYLNSKVVGIFKSDKYPNVTVMRKESEGKKAGALNAGLNIAKHRFVCTMDADTVLEKNALLWAMEPIHRDPDRVIGVGCSFGLVNGFNIKDGMIMHRSCSYNPIIAYQNLEYIRSFISNRLAWSRFNVTPIVAGGFGIWRSDILYELGGYSSDFSSEDLEFTFRANEYIAVHKEKKYKILMLPYYVGWTEGPATIKTLIQQRDRWQRVVIETIYKYRYMMCNPKYGSFAFLVFPYFIFYEVFGVFFEVSSVFLVTIGWITKVLDLKVFLLFLVFMALSQIVISLLSLFAFLRGKKVFDIRYILYLIFLSFVEFFSYRFIISWSKLNGVYHYLRKKRVFDQYIRSKR